MSDKSDHLIERAAALLRSANAGQVVDNTTTARGPSAPSTPETSRPSTEPHRAIPPRMPASPPLPSPIAPGRRGPPVRSASVADIRNSLKHSPIPLAVLERAGLVVARGKRTRTAEEYRVVMGRVLRALQEEPDAEAPISPEIPENVVMITSARPGEGKSFTALNLSGSVAQHAGDSVLLVDVDAKNDCITDHLGIGDLPGFLDLVTDPGLAIEDLILPTELPNLFVLPLGRRTGGAGQQVMDLHLEVRQVAAPISRLARRFPKSLVVLDAPPTLSTSDPHALAAAVGQIVLVVEAEKTQRTEIEAAIDMVRECPNITLLLNKIRTGTRYTFGSYDYFGSYT